MRLWAAEETGLVNGDAHSSLRSQAKQKQA